MRRAPRSSPRSATSTCSASSTRKDLNKANEAGTLLAALDDLRRRHGTLFRVVHHYRKSRGLALGRGSQGDRGQLRARRLWGECSMFFEPVGRTQGAVRVVVQTKDGPPAPPFLLRFVSEGPDHRPHPGALHRRDRGGGPLHR